MTTKKNNSLFDYYGFTEKDIKKYPVISGVLRQLTPDRIRMENETVLETELPPEIQKWVKEYEKVGERNKFIWKWLYAMFQITNLSIISSKYENSILKIKTLLTMFICQLDDAVDKYKKYNLLGELLKIPSNEKEIKLYNLNNEEKKYLIFSKSLWNYIVKQIKKYPRFKKFNEVLSFDIDQIINEMKYSRLINHNIYLFNKAECWQFMPYNMVAFVYSDLDLICTSMSIIDFKKIGRIREIIFEAQKMARIGNWISTWERETKEKDFANGVFAYALDLNIFTVDDLKKQKELNIIEKIKKNKIEKKLLQEWENSYWKINKIGEKIKEKFFTNKFANKLKRLMIFHLSSKGHK